ncbi:MAG: hypothetical protein Fur005_48620 [Roseiflexaceae bacterium]
MQIAELIHRLTIPHRAQAAYRTLLGMGFAVAPIALAGLRHSHADVRYYCCMLLDHFLIPDALPALIAVLGDPDPRVRVSALHTLACDRCKEGSCRPEGAAVLPEALRILNEDPNAHVRAMAIEVIGQYVHTNPLAAQALLNSKQHDSNPTVRKKAGWYAPGGSIHTRTAPRRTPP